MCFGGVDLRGRGQRTHVGAEIVGGRQLHRRHIRGEPLGEVVGDLLVDVDPFDRDAQLPGVGVRRARRAAHGVGDVGTRGDDHRVLAAEFGREADEPTPGLFGEGGPGLRGAGEHHVVGAGHDCLPDNASRPGHHGVQLTRQTRLVQQLGQGQRAVRRLAVRLDYDAVAGDQGGHRIGHGQCQRVVPRADDADHTLGQVPHAHAGRARQHALDLAIGQQLGSVRRVVPRGDRDVDDLFLRVDARLAGLGLRDVHQRRRVAVDQVGETVDDRGAVGRRAGRPSLLRLAGPGDRHLEIVGGGDRDGRHLRPAERLEDGARGTTRGVVDGDERTQASEIVGGGLRHGGAPQRCAGVRSSMSIVVCGRGSTGCLPPRRARCRRRRSRRCRRG